MQPLRPAEIEEFLNRFRFRGGRMRALRIRQPSRSDPSIDIWLSVRRNPRDLSEAVRCRLRLHIARASEFCFRKRPNIGLDVLNGLEIGYFQGTFFVNFDPWDLDGERPAIHDFRGSEAYAAGGALSWEAVEIPPRKEEQP